MNLTVGSAVTAASTTETVVIVGPSGFEVTTMAGVANVTKIKVSQPASVVVDSTGETIAGQVVSIS